MIRRSIEIIASSFKMALQELWKNKLRTFLSLFGITIGIFCIIGVLATVNSLEKNIQNEVKSLGSNSIYIDKWQWGGGPDYPWWKYVNRPSPKYSELGEIKARTPSAQYAAFAINVADFVEYEGNELSNVKIYGVTEDFEDIQSLAIEYGRYMSDPEFDRGLSIAVMGYDVAEALFGSADLALGKEVDVRGKKVQVTGIIKKQGKQMMGGGWDFDQSLILPYKFARTIMNERKAEPFIMVKGPEGLSSKALKEDLTGTMRAIHKLTPTKEDDFALNDINDFSEDISEAFGALNIGGWAIAALSLIVGMFGVANIMFVTVRERTGQIGLKKAIGAKSRVILTEFLLESAFLCVIGGMIGLLLVFLLTQLLTVVLNFPVYISTTYMILAILICIVVGVLAGFIPALQAARLNPVVAIRSK
ncbi:MAG TPA: ABC transporter permease [Chitinophagaceae bacterium]|jgi:putative ABC transport system permease protein|nr:ABC transporter permease [Chitinophagaceae bacterium]